MIERLMNIFLSRKVFYISAICGLVLLAPSLLYINLILGSQVVGVVLVMFFVVFGFGMVAAYRRNDLVMLRDTTSALFVTLALSMSVSFQLFDLDSNDVVLAEGLLYCIMYSLDMMIISVAVMIVFNHFTITAEHSHRVIKIVVNQFSIGVLVLVYAAELVIIALMYGAFYFLVYFCIFLGMILVITAMNCSDIRLARADIDEKLGMDLSKAERRKLAYALVLLFSFFLGSFSITMLLLIQDMNSLFYIAVGFLVIVQFAGLVVCMMDMRAARERGGARLAFLKGLKFANIAFIPLSVLCAVFFAIMMVAQFHNELTPDARGDFSDIDMEAVAAADHSYVYETDDMYIIFPQYDRIDFDFGTRPDRSDESVTLCTPACMCYELELSGTHENLLGDHVVDGTYYEDAHDFVPGFGGFAFYDGSAYFETHNKPWELLESAAEYDGDGFEEYVSISDGEIWDLDVPKLRSYRLLAELNGRVCIIDGTRLMAYSELVQHAHEIGATQAMYLDVGGKLNYSWYRDSNNKDVTLMGVSIMPFAHNWITFRID